MGTRQKPGEWSKRGAKDAAESVEVIYKALPKTKQMEYLGELNEALLFIQGAEIRAPE
jgi:hypothetical protein